MKLQQLRYLAAVVQNDLNITTAARKLHTSQPGVSKQLRLLEEELGFPVFGRDGRQLTSVTPLGREVVDRALRILEEVQNIRRLATDLKDEGSGSLSIATTHTQARYVLPAVIQRFKASFPKVDLHLHQGTSEQIADLARLDRVDFAVATGSPELFPGMALLPCYRWHRQIVVPRGHALAQDKAPTLATLAKFPIVTYTFSFTGRSSLPALFEAGGQKLNVALTAADSDVIKTYVRLGLGVGIIAGMAVDPREDADLAVIEAKHLFPEHLTWIGFRRGRLLRSYMYEFLRCFAPHLTRRRVDAAGRSGDALEQSGVFSDIELPEHVHGKVS
jgi:LysR family transcriptional regulator, cys regulon transcriptional activator